MVHCTQKHVITYTNSALSLEGALFWQETECICSRSHSHIPKDFKQTREFVGYSGQLAS